MLTACLCALNAAAVVVVDVKAVGTCSATAAAWKRPLRRSE